MRGPALPPPRCATLVEALAEARRTDTGLTFLDEAERPAFLSYADLYTRALARASALRRMGIARGDRVALVQRTGPAFVEALFAVQLAGAIPVPLYPPVRLGRMEEYHQRTAAMLQAVDARLVVADGRVRPLLGVAVAKARPPLGCIEETALASAPVEGAFAEPDAQDLALIQFSSGSTTDPKPVALTHANVLANIVAIDQFLPESDPLRQAGVSWLPLYHDMGLIGCLLLAVYHPGPLTLLPPELFLAKPAVWLRAITRARATIAVAPNFAFGLCLKRVRGEELASVDLSSLRLTLCGAEPLAPGMLRRFCERFAPHGFEARTLTPVYGLSEATLAATFTPPGRGMRTRVSETRELVSVGEPVAGVEVEVRDEQGRAAPDGQSGRIFLRGPSVMAGYFRRPDATAEVLPDGWLDTGDLGFVLEGELYISGRAKDVVILRGANHSPQEFEECLDGLEGVRAGCAVAFGLTVDMDEGEELAFLVERDPGVEADDLGQAIALRVLQRTGIRPRWVHLLEPGTLPRTSSGKLRRLEARARFMAGSLDAPKKVTLPRIALELARSRLAFARSRAGTAPDPSDAREK